ncbi:hypothetical protein [Actinomadura alba]|uniref:Lipoprotein n=1 Tax=Actinomadura alba TaxID=406431 RepID=A0ABR7LK67_9ACTN|nr:hypothetical protein [Actinomadura alba]MBC6465078.1 hypothetical protein [Actinomadura alba]
MRIRALAMSLCLIVSGTAGCAVETPRHVSPSSAIRLDQPRLVQPDPSEFGAALPTTRTGTPYTFADIVVCLNRPGKVTVESAVVVGPSGGLRLDALATRPSVNGRSQVGGANLSLAKLGFSPGGATVIDRVCPAAPRGAGAVGNYYELGLQFSKTDDVTATGHGVDVHYHTEAGAEMTLRIPFILVLCKGRDPAVPDCG